MNKNELIRTIESSPSDVILRTDALEAINALDDDRTINIDLLKEDFKKYYPYKHDLPSVFEILNAFKGDLPNEKSLLDIVDDFKKIASENDYKTVLTIVNIKGDTFDYVFKKSDFIRIEGLRLFLKSDDRELFLYDISERVTLMNQMNN